MSQFLARIEREIQSAAEPWLRAVSIARRACYWARVGRFADARGSVIEIRARFGQGQDARVTIWLMLLEGLIQLYESLAPGAKDRIDRAQFLSLAIRDNELIAITSAWKAHIEFETSKYGQMIESLKTALSHTTNQNYEANSRIAMIVADLHYMCGQRSYAQHWFMVSRDHALAAGDQASIDALLYNRAAFGLAYLRSKRCIEPLDQQVVAAVGMEVASAKNFQALTQIEAFENCIFLCEARVLMLANDFAAAYRALEAVRAKGPFAPYNFSQDLIELELAFCSFKLGMKSSATAHFEKIRDKQFSELDADERLVVQWMRVELARGDVSFGVEADERSNLAPLVEEYSASMAKLSSAIEAFRDPPESIRLH